MNRFIIQEMLVRKQFEYPPFYYLTLVQVTHEDVMMAAEYAKLATDWLRDRIYPLQRMVIGPTACAISQDSK